MDILLALLFGAFIGTLLVYVALFSSFVKNQNNETQNINNEIQCLLDEMSPRDFYIHKMSQTSLEWDSKTNTYVKKWSNNDDT